MTSGATRIGEPDPDASPRRAATRKQAPLCDCRCNTCVRFWRLYHLHSRCRVAPQRRFGSLDALWSALAPDPARRRPFPPGLARFGHSAVLLQGGMWVFGGVIHRDAVATTQLWRMDLAQMSWQLVLPEDGINRQRAPFTPPWRLTAPAFLLQAACAL